MKMIVAPVVKPPAKPDPVDDADTTADGKEEKKQNDDSADDVLRDGYVSMLKALKEPQQIIALESSVFTALLTQHASYVFFTANAKCHPYMTHDLSHLGSWLFTGTSHFFKPPWISM